MRSQYFYSGLRASSLHNALAFCRSAAKSAADPGVVSETVVEPRLSPAAHPAMVEGVATTDDLATVPVVDTATQEVALEDITDPLMIQDVEKVNPSSIDVMAKDADAPVIESPAADSLRSPILRAEVASSSSTSRAERLSEAIIASNDKQAMVLRKALSDLSAAYKVNFYFQLSVSSPQGSSFFFDCKGRLDTSL